MKGIVFTEFLEMVEQTYSLEMLDNLIESVALESGGIYTSVGTYDHKELVSLLGELSQRTKIEVPVLLRDFGRHLGLTFSKKYATFFEAASDSFQFLESVDQHIHIEVRKLYADAELPKFSTRRLESGDFELHYVSSRHFEDLAYGLIEASVLYYGQSIAIGMSRTPEGALFLLRPN